MSKLRLIFLIILIPLFFFECEQNSPVPNVNVNFIIELNNPVYSSLNAVGNSTIILHEGYKGIIVTRVDQQVFSAYDMTCTYDPNDEWGRVVPDKSGVFAVDTVCGSSFHLLVNGMVDKGPASIPLKMYAADYNSYSNTLHIHN
jgi:hypothetical protein